MTYQEIQGHLQEMYGVELSRNLSSSITDAIMDEVTTWQSRPLDSAYPVLYLEAFCQIWDAKYPTIGKAWRRDWDQLTLFF